MKYCVYTHNTFLQPWITLNKTHMKYRIYTHNTFLQFWITLNKTLVREHNRKIVKLTYLYFFIKT